MMLLHRRKETKNDGDFYEGLDYDDEFYGGAEL